MRQDEHELLPTLVGEAMDLAVCAAGSGADCSGLSYCLLRSRSWTEPWGCCWNTSFRRCSHGDIASKTVAGWSDLPGTGEDTPCE